MSTRGTKTLQRSSMVSKYISDYAVYRTCRIDTGRTAYNQEPQSSTLKQHITGTLIKTKPNLVIINITYLVVPTLKLRLYEEKSSSHNDK